MTLFPHRARDDLCPSTDLTFKSRRCSSWPCSCLSFSLSMPSSSPFSSRSPRRLTSCSVALWDKGLFGYNYPNQASDTTQNYNTNDPVIPLKAEQKLTVDQWFGRGRLNYPPKSGDFMQLPAGGTYKGELACNRADSKLRDPRRTDAQPNFACDVSPHSQAQAERRAPS